MELKLFNLMIYLTLADYQLFINCGGKAVTVDNHEYDADNNSQLARSTFSISVDERWAFSSTGHFVDNDESPKYVTGNTSVLNMTNPEPYYMSARLSPMSLKYYGLCLQKGNYNVSLYFAEIMFTNDQTFSSVGRRIFDVSIQVLKAATTKSISALVYYLTSFLEFDLRYFLSTILCPVIWWKGILS